VHVPDGFLGPQTYGPGTAVAGLAWLWALRRFRRGLGQVALARLGVLSALAFVVGTVAIPLPGGTTTHLTGVPLLALLFGVWTTYLVSSVVLALQAVLLGEGGITSLGCNALAMGLVGAAVTRGTWYLLGRRPGGVGVFVAAWVGILASAAAVALLLGLQPAIAHTPEGEPLYFPFPLTVTLPAVLGPHLLTGAAEGFLTVLVLGFLRRVVPGLLGPKAETRNAIPEG
jgi:cobalt/nickel transport system permease protein